MGEPGWRDEVVAAAGAAGEAAWAMPLPDGAARAGSTRPWPIWSTSRPNGSAACWSPAAFLAEFVPDGLPWVHLDIAGPAFNQGGARDYTPKGGTGAGVRTIIAAVERLAAG